MTALREIRILQLLNHENVANLIEICRSKGSTNNDCTLNSDVIISFLCCVCVCVC